MGKLEFVFFRSISILNKNCHNLLNIVLLKSLYNFQIQIDIDLKDTNSNFAQFYDLKKKFLKITLIIIFD